MKRLIALTYYSIILLLIAPIMMNNQPLVIFNTHSVLSPIVSDYTEQTLGGDSDLLIDYSKESQLLQQYFVISPPYPHSITEHQKPLCQFSLSHPLGTSLSGQDNLVYLVYAICYSLLTATSLTTLSVIAGSTMGLLSSLYPGKTSAFIQWLMEVIRSIPLALVIVLTQQQLGLFMFMFTCTQWSRYGQVIRQQTNDLMTQPYMIDAMLSGTSPLNVVKTHILPHIKHRWGKQIPYTFINYLATLQGLAYFGVEIINKPSLGGLIRDNQQHPDAILITIICCGLFKLIANHICD